MKLTQKSFLNGTREFELIDDVVSVRVKKFFTQEKHSVGLLILNPEPVVNGPYLEFHDRFKGHLLLSLRLNEPNTEEFNTFVTALKQGALRLTPPVAEAEASDPESSRRQALARNMFEEPPEFAEPDDTQAKASFIPVNAARLADDIVMLKTYLDERDIRPLLDVLETLVEEPQNEAAYQKMLDTYNGLGILSGAVLTYAPYLKVLLSQSISL
ncbi:MAG: hypothetical protein R6X06_04485 [Gammaproteobacteria bacterium]